MKKSIIAATIALCIFTSAVAQDTKKNQPAGKHIIGQDSTSPHRPPVSPTNDTARKPTKDKPLGNKKETVQPKGINPDSTRANGISPDMHH